MINYYMYVFLEYNENIKNNITELKNENIDYIILFKLFLKNKEQIKKDLENIEQIKKNLNQNINAIQINIDKIDNSTQGIINNLKNNFDIVIGFGGLNKVNRFLIENTKIDFIQDPHNNLFVSKIDFIHHFNSGLNHVLCKLAKENEIYFLFTINFLKDTNKFNQSKNIGRINQNIKLAKKYDIKTHINVIIENKEDITYLKNINKILNIFDFPSNQKKQNNLILDDKIKNSFYKKSSQYIKKEIYFTK